jgi:protein-disulfide isomerase
MPHDRYAIRVAGQLGATALAGFPDFDSETDGSQTTLSGELSDPSELYRALGQLEALGLEVIDIHRPAAARASGGMAVTQSVDTRRDHIRGPEDARVTVVEYGDFECPHCARAEDVLRKLRSRFGDDMRLVWRHLPLSELHPHARQAAEAAEAAGAQGAFWAMHDLLLAHQQALTYGDLFRYADRLGLGAARFREDLHAHRTTARVQRDVESAQASGVAGTPTFFINGRRHDGGLDVASLDAAIRRARSRIAV